MKSVMGIMKSIVRILAIIFLAIDLLSGDFFAAFIMLTVVLLLGDK